jgi:superfamily II DNA or RNA helicase
MPPRDQPWDEMGWDDDEFFEGDPLDGVRQVVVTQSPPVLTRPEAPWLAPRAPIGTAGRAAPTNRPPTWQERLSTLSQAMDSRAWRDREPWPAGRQILYVIDVAATMQGLGLVLEVSSRERKRDGSWTKLRNAKIHSAQLATLPDESDRKILALLFGPQDVYGGYSAPYHNSPNRYRLSEALQGALLPLICETGRCVLRVVGSIPELLPIRWDGGPPWEIWLSVRAAPDGPYATAIDLRREGERLDLTVPVMLISGGLVFTTDRVARLADDGLFQWVAEWRREGELRVPTDKIGGWLAQVLSLSSVPRLDLPPELAYEEITLAPRPRLVVRSAYRNRYRSESRLGGHLSFDYGGAVVAAAHAGRGVLQADRRQFIRRDIGAERRAAARLLELGFRKRSPYQAGSDGATIDLAPRHLPRVVSALLEEGWHVEAEGRRYRRAGPIRLEVSSGVDWFDLSGDVEFEGTVAALPELLAAVRRGEGVVRLGDGTYGLLPEEWLARVFPLATLGTAQGGHVRFTRAQVGVLDAVVGMQSDITCDETFVRAREELRRFDGVHPADAPEGFVGELRPYQREGLGWLQFLQRFGFGGCLADDMGLGKTVMVLALLEARRQQRAPSSTADDPGPSLAVVPRSLVFNWKQEAARFTPKLRVLEHTGAGRLAPGEHFEGYDLVLTTYGTLRRDAGAFARTRFDYAILDEAQAIKNASTDSAKAARLLQADHRLALSGTPVENHLGELWSLFEYLNPGMLGKASVFQQEGAGLRSPDERTRRLLARALRPFILRRTKEQVARDLPPKVEQTLYCELEPGQRALYNELRQHYRRALLGRLDEAGLKRAKIQVLEALLRMRQAACHPGLIDPKRADESCAKLDALMPQLLEVVAEGHKALVFSQFTSFLAIVRAQLLREGIVFEYLDGRTRDRGPRVERFQTDPGCPLFLISLKAGGLGLNLTAADYVFLLDPWWNPAVEAQAIDRTHRIGQSRQVFAYRLVVRDSVEEKILELQRTKRALADAILGADESLISSLTREDLELLLS